MQPHSALAGTSVFTTEYWLGKQVGKVPGEGPDEKIHVGLQKMGVRERNNGGRDVNR